MSYLFSSETKQVKDFIDDWSFSDKTIQDTAYITHGYYTYPAKFIPQLAARLIQEHSQINDIIIDPFMGSGTTVIESVVNGRIGIGTDINEIAVLVSKVKSTPIDLKVLKCKYQDFIWKLQKSLNKNFEEELHLAQEKIKLPERVDYWFQKNIKEQLLIVLNHILQINHIDTKDFFLVAFAQILKSCSIWLQKSVKPTRDLNKKPVEPLFKLNGQIQKMIKKHKEFNEILSNKIFENIDQYRKIQNTDARNLPCEDNQANLIVTSPPYVTSYEYADLHQLPCLWFGYLQELSSFRKKFIGSSYREKKQSDLKSEIAMKIISQLKNKKKQEVQNYFSDMLESFVEMKRVLKKKGKTAIIIGNTKFQGVNILNAEVFQEQLENIGFQTVQMIERKIPSKMLPSTRDPKTGRFTSVQNQKKCFVYPKETILIMKKR